MCGCLQRNHESGFVQKLFFFLLLFFEVRNSFPSLAFNLKEYVCLDVWTHTVHIKSDGLSSHPKAFWLYCFPCPSVITTINTVGLFCDTQGLWTHSQCALDALHSFSLTLAHRPSDIHTHTHKDVFRRPTHSCNYGLCVIVHTCVFVYSIMHQYMWNVFSG